MPSGKWTISKSQILRAANLIFKEELEDQGIKLFRYNIDPKELENNATNPDNSAYFQFGPSGVVNLTAAFGGLSKKHRNTDTLGMKVFLSKPHFLDADPFYLEHVQGLIPDRAKHDTNIDVEPVGLECIQLTIPDNRNDNESREEAPTQSGHRGCHHAVPRHLYNLRTYLLDWRGENTIEAVPTFSQSSEVTADLAKQFKDTVYKAQNASQVVRYVGFIGGAIITCVALGLFIAVYFKLYKEEPRSGYATIPDPQEDEDSR